MVWQVAKAVQIPVIGIGGITNATDVIEFLLAGATAIQVGTYNFVDPLSPLKMIEGLQEYMERHNINEIQELIGALQV
ncbi:Dihydroorotate dehydrogenase B (NAD(+))%2C catalytic subunit [Chlamydia trachomatis]|nr:Dihydroorotate dehydrogenase B (NAD(+))%2C catalytic subunit [Chlamydia trachomatis]